MGAPKKPEWMVERIRSLWAEDANQSALGVWDRFYEESGRRTLISKRKVQIIIKEAILTAGVGFEALRWTPWQDPSETAEDVGYLMSMDANWMMKFLRHLHQHEARWAKRLRAVLTNVNPELRLLFIHEYGMREVMSSNLGRKTPYTVDLDSLLTVKPWMRDVEEGLVAYDLLLGHKVVVPPPYYKANQIPSQMNPSDADPWGIYELAESLKPLRERFHMIGPLNPMAEESGHDDEWTRLAERFGLEVQPPITGYRIMNDYPYLTWIFVKAMKQLSSQEFDGEDRKGAKL